MAAEAFGLLLQKRQSTGNFKCGAVSRLHNGLPSAAEWKITDLSY